MRSSGTVVDEKHDHELLIACDTKLMMEAHKARRGPVISGLSVPVGD